LAEEPAVRLMENQAVWPENISILLTALRQVNARRLWKLCWVRPAGTHEQNSLWFSFLCLADKHSSDLKRQLPNKPQTQQIQRLTTHILLCYKL
jgi:hypothetical protein